jgi:hypothetical protein
MIFVFEELTNDGWKLHNPAWRRQNFYPMFVADGYHQLLSMWHTNNVIRLLDLIARPDIRLRAVSEQEAEEIRAMSCR